MDDRLEVVTRLLKQLPILGAGSSKEPWAKLRLIDVTKIIEVADGKTHPDEWVDEGCASEFEHSPHWWNEYQDGPYPAECTRTPHWCAGNDARRKDEHSNLPGAR